MKFNFFKSAAALLSIGILMTGCNSDDFLTDNEIPVEKDTDFYINVKIATPAESETRANDNFSAGDYINGTEDEQKIHEILFVFFNSNHQYVGNSTYIPTETDKKPGDNGSVETVMNITVPVTVAAGSTKPAYVMAYVNPTNRSKNDLLNDYYTALGAFRKLNDVIPTDNHNGYSMNNSVYYEQKKDDESPTIAVPISDKQLFTSEEEAKANTTTAQVIIYVERIVAKVTLDKSKTKPWTETDNTVVDENENKYTLEFEVLGWGLSNLERNTFLVKNFREDVFDNPTDFDSPFTFTNFTWKVLDGRLNNPADPTKSLTAPAWNYPGSPDKTGDWGISGHRTFWALSPTYYHTNVKIPAYADEIYDGTKVNEKGSSLIYRSFNDIYNTKSTPVVGNFGKSMGETQYTLEHTMQASMVTEYQKRAVTSAIVVGKYKLKAEDGTNMTYDDFFMRKIVTEANTKYILYPSVEDMKKAYLAANITLFIKKEGENGEVSYEKVPFATPEGGTITTYFDDFTIEHPRKDITGDYIPSRYVTLKLKDGFTHEYFYQDANAQYLPVTESNLKAVNKLLYENMIGMLGGIEEYHNGYAYFEIPIRHLWGRDNKSIGEKDFEAQLGQYGIVRNHCYNVFVEGIQGIGIGISDPDAPIIPNLENDKYFVKTEIRVQRWRVAPNQNVILKP